MTYVDFIEQYIINDSPITPEVIRLIKERNNSKGRLFFTMAYLSCITDKPIINSMAIPLAYKCIKNHTIRTHDKSFKFPMFFKKLKDIDPIVIKSLLYNNRHVRVIKHVKYRPRYGHFKMILLNTDNGAAE